MAKASTMTIPVTVEIDYTHPDLVSDDEYVPTEFENQIIAILRMHLNKSKDYGSDEDPFQNFYEAALERDCTPLEAAEGMVAKQRAAIKIRNRKIRKGADRTYTDASYDWYLDDAVYGIIKLCLYLREKDGY